MANTQSTELALLEASPAGIADRQLVGAAHILTQGNVEFDPISVSDTLQICRVPIDAVLASIQMAFDGLGATLTVDLGFREVGSPGAVILKDAIIDGLSVATAVSLAEYRYSTLDINTTGERMWELAGLADRPDYEEVDIVLEVATSATPVEATVAWIIEYMR